MCCRSIASKNGCCEAGMGRPGWRSLRLPLKSRLRSRESYFVWLPWLPWLLCLPEVGKLTLVEPAEASTSLVPAPERLPAVASGPLQPAALK